MHLNHISVVFRSSPMYRTRLYPYVRFNVPSTFSTFALILTLDINSFLSL